MAQRRDHNYEAPLISYNENSRVSGLIEATRYRGFNRVEINGALSFKIAHDAFGVGVDGKPYGFVGSRLPDIDDNLGNYSGIWVTKQGTVIRETEAIPTADLTLNANTGSSRRIDLLVGKHSHDEIVGGVAATYIIRQGNPTLLSDETLLGKFILEPGFNNLSDNDSWEYIPEPARGLGGDIYAMWERSNFFEGTNHENHATGQAIYSSSDDAIVINNDRGNVIDMPLPTPPKDNTDFRLFYIKYDEAKPGTRIFLNFRGKYANSQDNNGGVGNNPTGSVTPDGEIGRQWFISDPHFYPDTSLVDQGYHPIVCSTLGVAYGGPQSTGLLPVFNGDLVELVLVRDEWIHDPAYSGNKYSWKVISTSSSASNSRLLETLDLGEVSNQVNQINVDITNLEQDFLNLQNQILNLENDLNEVSSWVTSQVIRWGNRNDIDDIAISDIGLRNSTIDSFGSFNFNFSTGSVFQLGGNNYSIPIDSPDFSTDNELITRYTINRHLVRANFHMIINLDISVIVNNPSLGIYFEIPSGPTTIAGFPPRFQRGITSSLATTLLDDLRSESVMFGFRTSSDGDSIPIPVSSSPSPVNNYMTRFRINLGFVSPASLTANDINPLRLVGSIDYYAPVRDTLPNITY